MASSGVTINSVNYILCDEVYNKNQGNTRLNITIKKKTLLTDSKYIFRQIMPSSGNTIDFSRWNNLPKYILSQSIVVFFLVFFFYCDI
jgi:hypothetical protein